MAWVWAEIKGSVFLLILRLKNNESAYLLATTHSQDRYTSTSHNK